jgi:amino acid adenylation domain-containing protein
LSYGELNRRANQLAHHLQNMGVGPEVAVAICVERSVEMVIGFLGILKAGGHYVPLDRSYPKERLALMLKDSGAAVLLTQQRLREILPEQEMPVLCLDADWETIAGESAETPVSNVTAANLAYIIYTSGSTGQPKGVAVTHANLLNLVTWHTRIYQVTPEDRATQVASLGFDASVWELWPYLSSGASVFLPDEDTRTTPSRFVAWLNKQRITLCFVPTPLAEIILTEPMPAELSLRALLVGGDKLHGAPKDALPFDLVNHYGPTENTVVATYTNVPTGVDSDEAPPIGRPIANTRIYLLDEYLEPVPVGVPGQLYIGGESLARGYHQDPGMTAQKFIPDPFSTDAGQRLYQTGDLVRYQTDGNLQFIGRVDHQVKIRGYRVELGEIESLLSQHPAVRETIVLARGDGPGASLVAYLVPDLATAPEVSDLRTYLGEKLPDYMVPSAFVVLSAMPLTANGKIDLQALPSPDQMISSEDTAYVEPRTETERKVAGIWQELLEVERVGIHDNFFEIGGHSLLMVQAQSKLQDLFNRELTTIELFQYPTVHSLANFLDQEAPEGSLAQESQDRAEMRRASMEARRQAKYDADQTDGEQQADEAARAAVITD